MPRATNVRLLIMKQILAQWNHRRVANDPEDGCWDDHQQILTCSGLGVAADLDAEPHFPQEQSTVSCETRIWCLPGYSIQSCI